MSHHTPFAPSTGQQKNTGTTHVAMESANGVRKASQLRGQCQPVVTLCTMAFVMSTNEIAIHTTNSSTHHCSEVSLTSM